MLQINLIGNSMNKFHSRFQIATKVLNFIIDAHLSFNVSQTPSLQVLLETVSGRKVNMPTRYKIMHTLDAEFEKMKAILKELLNKQKYLCVTADVWTSHARSFLGVTVHFIDDDFVRQSYLLGFKQLDRRQTHDILAKALNDIFQDFNLLITQIINIITDGGSAFCKMFKKYGDPIDAIDIDTNSEEIDEGTGAVPAETSEEDTQQPSMVDEHGNEFVSEIITLDSQADGPNVPIEGQNNNDEMSNYFGGITSNQPVNAPQIKLPPQRRCASHLVNLISKDFEKHLDRVAKNAFKNTFNSLHSLWSIIRNSSCAKTICKEILGVILLFPTETRWNSKFDCVKQCNR